MHLNNRLLFGCHCFQLWILTFFLRLLEQLQGIFMVGHSSQLDVLLVAILQLRKKLEVAELKISTVRGLGYSLKKADE